MLYLFEDERSRSFEPFASTRPVGSLLAGTAPIWERWQTIVQGGCTGYVNAPALVDFEEPGTPKVVASGVIPKGAIVGNSRFVPALSVISDPASVGRWYHDGRLAAVRTKQELSVEATQTPEFTLESVAVSEGRDEDIPGWWHEEIWDFIRYLPEQISDDITRLARLPQMAEQIAHWGSPQHATILGAHPVIVHGGIDGDQAAPAAVIEPHVVLDASAGPILIGSGVHVHAFTRIVGPCYIGRNSTILGGDVTSCSIGPVCKVRGEVNSAIFLGYANKGHDGFVGHSYLGRWVNLGAGTVTSNLKNTYGPVSLWTPSGVRDTGMQFLGTLFGDHVKTGIGLRLTTGTVIGAGTNVFDEMPPKAVAPFSWGSRPPYATYQLEKFLETAGRMMARRNAEMTEGLRRHFMSVHAQRWSTDEEARTS